jgi:CubicO group peptidase (beta-lactamase class C family)
MPLSVDHERNTMPTVETQEVVAPGLENVVKIFREGVVEPERSGAALSIWRDGEEIVNVWHGVRDSRTGEAWEANTTSVIFSSSKGLSSIVVGQLQQQGLLDFDQPIADIWPEFAAHGKGTISIGDVLAHRAGVSSPVEDLTLEDAFDVRGWAQKIADQEPLWVPGTAHAYHALSFGTIVQEIVRRVTGKELHQLFAENVAEPLHADVTLKAQADDLSRIAHLVTSEAWQQFALLPFDDRVARALTLGGAMPLTLATETGGFNDPRVQTAGFAAAGGVGTASALGKIWSATIGPTDGVRLLEDDTISALTRVRSEGPGAFDSPPPYQRWGVGVELASDASPHLSDGTFGHGGAGGQGAFADPETGIALGYLRNRLDVVNSVDPILAALKEAL